MTRKNYATKYCLTFFAIVMLLVSCGGNDYRHSSGRYSGFLDTLGVIFSTQTSDSALNYIKAAEMSGDIEYDSLQYAYAYYYELQFNGDSARAFYKRVIDNPDGDKGSLLYVKAIRALADLYSGSNTDEAMRLCRLGDSVSVFMGYDLERAMIRYVMGKSLLTRDNERAVGYLRESISMNRNVDNSEAWGNLFHASVTLMNAYVIMDKSEECIKTGDELVAFIDTLGSSFNADEYDPAHSLRFNFHVLRCMSFMDLGMRREAGMEYAECQKYSSNSPSAPVAMAHCLKLMGRWDEARELLFTLEEKYKTDGDTLTNEFISVLDNISKCYLHDDNFEKAYRYISRISGIRREKYLRDEKTKIAEMEAAFNMKDKEMELRSMEEQRTVYRLVLLALSFFLIILSVVLYISFRYNRKLDEKNKSLAMRVNDVLDLHASSNGANPVNEAGEGEEQTATDETVRQIMNFVNELKTRKLYCDPDFHRDDLLNELRMNKRTFARDFEVVMGSSFIKYLSVLRVEYAADQIRRNPNYTIEAIAMESGISSRASFYRLFSDYFGITPTEYRHQLLALD